MAMRHLYQVEESVEKVAESEIAAAFKWLQSFQSGFLEELGHDKPTKDNLTRYALALLIETAEFSNELPWKTWKPGMEFDSNLLADEFADIMAFVGTWIHYLNELGIDPDQLSEAYMRKRKKNVARFEGTSGEKGYDGVTS